MKYFVLSDIHGDYEAMMAGLLQAKYDLSDSGHRIVSLGDNFGRASTGLKSKGVWNYLISHKHKNAPICIRGNHESILLDVLDKGYLDYVDCRNGEDLTISSFAHCSKSQAAWPESVRAAADLGLGKWVEKLPWYFETENHIFVHGWVPEEKGIIVEKLSEVSEKVWDEMSWSETPSNIIAFFQNYPAGYKKTIVFGHLGTYLLFRQFNGHMGEKLYKPWIDSQHKLVGLDQTTALSHSFEVLVVEDNPLSTREII